MDIGNTKRKPSQKRDEGKIRVEIDRRETPRKVNQKQSKKQPEGQKGHWSWFSAGFIIKDVQRLNVTILAITLSECMSRHRERSPYTRDSLGLLEENSRKKQENADNGPAQESKDSAPQAVAPRKLLQRAQHLHRKKFNPTSSHENAEHWGYCPAVILRAHQLTHCTDGETEA